MTVRGPARWHPGDTLTIRRAADPELGLGPESDRSTRLRAASEPLGAGVHVASGWQSRQAGGQAGWWV